jgi:hypothetical protein
LLLIEVLDPLSFAIDIHWQGLVGNVG